MKYCNQCGARLANVDEEDSLKEKRFDDYVDGLFWITLIGLGMVLGGMVLIKLVLKMSESVVLGYGVLSAAAFIAVFAICLWKMFQMSRKRNASEKTEGIDEMELDTNKLAGAAARASLEEPVSIIENTTRTLEKVPRENSQS